MHQTRRPVAFVLRNLLAGRILFPLWISERVLPAVLQYPAIKLTCLRRRMMRVAGLEGEGFAAAQMLEFHAPTPNLHSTSAPRVGISEQPRVPVGRLGLESEP